MLARRRFGIVSRHELIEVGFSTSAVARAVAAGRLIQLHRGVYAVGHVPTDPRTHWLAATLACGPFAVLSHSSGGEHQGLLKPRSGLIDVTIQGQSGRSRSTVRIHRARLEADETGVVDGIPCASPSRVILDVAATRPAVLEHAIKEAGGRGLLDVAEVMSLLDRYPRRHGARRIRRLLIGHEPIPEFTRSLLEILMYELCRREGIDCPRMNQRIATDRGSFECDCVWFDRRLIIECDSRWHDNPLTATDDALRDEALTLAGWRVHRLRWAQIVMAPERASHTIRHLLMMQDQLLRAAG